MSFWNYIGEFFLFRWLFGKIKKSTTEHYAHTERLGTAIDRDSDGDYNSSGRHSSHNDWNSGSYSQSYDEFQDEQDDYDMMDDDF